MPASIGVNLRVTGHCRQGGRKYMEDFFSVAYQQTEDEKDLEYAFVGIYDGHGGAEAAAFAKEHLMETIIKHKNFWSENDEDILRAIKDGYIATHYAMWKEQEKWPRTASGLPSTAGTTASVAFIRRGKIYIGHVGDSGIILGYQDPGCSDWKAKPLTRDHKPENIDEMTRIEQCGGKVIAKSGVPRVVWNRPKIGHRGPVRRSTPIDEIPFLAVARSLGDLWSYNSQINEFIVSPDPDCSVIEIDTNIHRCLIFGTDGLYNMLSPAMAVHIVQQAEKHNEHAALSDSYKTWLNPSKLLVEKALDRWITTKMRADNTSVVTLMLDPPGPPRAQVLKDRRKSAYPDRGLKIMTRYEDNQQENTSCTNCLQNIQCNKATPSNEDIPKPTLVSSNSEEIAKNVNKEMNQKNSENCTEGTTVGSSEVSTNYPLKERNFTPKFRESTSFDPRETRLHLDDYKENILASKNIEDDTIQINEVSSSSNDVDNFENKNVKAEKHNLRSLKKTKLVEEKSVEMVTRDKRKSEIHQNILNQRKSQRLDLSQRRMNQFADKIEENTENLGRRASGQQRSMVKLEKHFIKPKLTLTQKILKSKKMNLKKKNVIKKPLSRRKIKIVIDAVKHRQNPAMLTRVTKKEIITLPKVDSKLSLRRPSVKIQRDSTRRKSMQQKKNKHEKRNVAKSNNKIQISDSRNTKSAHCISSKCAQNISEKGREKQRNCVKLLSSIKRATRHSGGQPSAAVDKSEYFLTFMYHIL